MNPKSPAAETYRRLRTGIDLLGRSSGRELRAIAIASAERGEGKSTAAANLAIACARAKRSVLLIDADMRSPVQHLIFGLPNKTGISLLLADRCDIDETIWQTEIAGLDMMCAGPIAASPTELLDSQALDELLLTAKERYETVIVDTPALTAGADAQIVADKCDGAVLVIRRGKTKLAAAERAKEALLAGRARLVGAVFNTI